MIDPKIEDYCNEHTSVEPDILKRLNRETHLKTVYPRMLSGHLQGRLLAMISRMIKPRRILEIGTFTGYSCLCLAEGLDKNGIIHTIEAEPEMQEIFLKYFKEAGIEKKIQVHIGDAMIVIPELNEVFDLVFIDADKENYLNYYKMILPKVRQGGVILVDNALWSGKVLEEDFDKETQGIKELNDYIQKDSQTENVLLSVRDGLMMARKL